MTTEIYSRKPMAYAAVGLSFILCGGMLISFFRDYPKHMVKASGSTLAFGIMGGFVVIGFVAVCLYGAFRVVRPTRVEGSLTRTNGGLVTRQHNDLVIQIDGKKFKFPLDSSIDEKLSGLPSSQTIQVQMDVGAFGYALSVRVLQ
jgi:hypothetical protein